MATLPTTLYTRTWWRTSLPKRTRTKTASYRPVSLLTNTMNFEFSSSPMNHSLAHSIFQLSLIFGGNTFIFLFLLSAWKVIHFNRSTVFVLCLTWKLLLCRAVWWALSQRVCFTDVFYFSFLCLLLQEPILLSPQCFKDLNVMQLSLSLISEVTDAEQMLLVAVHPVGRQCK